MLDLHFAQIFRALSGEKVEKDFLQRQTEERGRNNFSPSKGSSAPFAYLKNLTSSKCLRQWLEGAEALDRAVDRADLLNHSHP